MKNSRLSKIVDYIARNGYLGAIIAVVLLTTASKALTQSVMVEIAGYAALSVLIANSTHYAFTPKQFHKSDAQGSYTVLAAIILGSFVLVGLCVLGIYFAKIDGAPTLASFLR